MKNKVINKLVSECSSDIQIAANTIRSGGVVGYLTDTLYGIGFESDIELNNWKILKPTGVFQVEENEK